MVWFLSFYSWSGVFYGQTEVLECPCELVKNVCVTVVDFISCWMMLLRSVKPYLYVTVCFL